MVKDLPVNTGTHIRSLARELIFHMPGDQKTKMQQRNNNIEIRQLITQCLPLTVQVKGRVHTSLSLNQKLELVKLSEEGM